MDRQRLDHQGYDDGNPLRPAGSIRRVKISHIVAHAPLSDQGILIDGIVGHRIEDLTLSDIVVYYKGGGTQAQGERIVEELDKVYPEPSLWGVLPSWGVWARHVTNLQLRDIELYTLTPDGRPAMMLEDVRGVTLDNVRVTPNPAASTLVVKDVANLNVHRSSGLPEFEGSRDVVSVAY